MTARLMLPLVLCAGVFGAIDPDGSTELHRATYKDDLETVRKLIRGGTEVNAANDLGVTPLWVACQNGSVAMVRLLLEAGANPNAALLKGETPLMVAARVGNAGIVEQLASKGANLNARGPRAQTALMWAVAQKHPDVVRVLLAYGADVHARSESWTQMMAVPPHGYLPYNRQIPHGGNTALLFAAREGDLESAKLLVAKGANVNDEDAWGVSVTVLAAHSGFTEFVEFLLNKGADASAAKAGFSALHEAIMRRDERMAKALLDHGADPNFPLKTWTPTRRSSADFHFEPVLVGASPYWLAARFAQPAVMRMLLQRGADGEYVHRAEYVIEKGFQKRTETASAAMAALGIGGGSPWVPAPAGKREALILETVKLAVESGADLSVASADGRTALDVAKAAKLESVVKYLVEQGAKSGKP